MGKNPHPTLYAEQTRDSAQYDPAVAHNRSAEFQS